MKKNRMSKRFIAIALSSVMMFNCGISVFAEESESDTYTEIVESIPVPETTVDAFEDYEMDDEGNTIITITTITEGQDESSSYYEDESSSMLVDWEGNIVEESSVVKGEQMYEGELEADLEINFEDLHQGEQASAATEDKDIVIGDVKEGEDDKEYDQTHIVETAKKAEAALDMVDVSTVENQLQNTTTTLVTSLNMIIGNKAADHENNADADDTNDAYNVDMSFGLAVSTTENDDLIVVIVDNEGNEVRKVRLAGDDSETNFGMIEQDEDGNYVIKGLELVEGRYFNMNIAGLKNLEEGIYVYKKEAGDMAVGEVELDEQIRFVIDVNDGTQKIHREWAEEWYSYEEPVRDTEPETEDTTPDDNNNTGNSTSRPTTRPSYNNYYNSNVEYEVNEDGLVEIDEEEVPLADAPETGSMAVVCLAAAAGSGLGMTAFVLKGKKEDEE